MNKFMQSCSTGVQLPDIYILSAKFGLIPGDKPIPNYDLRMTPKRVKELQQPTLSELEHILIGKQYEELFISLGKDYLEVLDGYESLTPTHLKVKISSGSIGRKLAELRNWLYGDTSAPPDKPAKVATQGKSTLRGIEIALTAEQVMEKAHAALAKEQDLPKYQIWYVKVGDQPVPVKWLVSQVTGLSVSAFHTNEARRVVRQLGIEVYSRL